MAPHTHSVCFVTCKGLANIFLVLVFLICLAGYARYARHHVRCLPPPDIVGLVDLSPRTMLQLLAAPLSGIEFQSSPLQSSRVHKRAEVRSAGKNPSAALPVTRALPVHGPARSLLSPAQVTATLRAPWDTNLDNIVDNIRLAWSGKVQTGTVRLSDWRHAGALLSCLASCVQVLHDVLVNYDKNANRWNLLDASIKADVVRAADVRLGCAPRPLSLHCAGRRCSAHTQLLSAACHRLQTSSSATSPTS